MFWYYFGSASSKFFMLFWEQILIIFVNLEGSLFIAKKEKCLWIFRGFTGGADAESNWYVEKAEMGFSALSPQTMRIITLALRVLTAVILFVSFIILVVNNQPYRTYKLETKVLRFYDKIGYRYAFDINHLSSLSVMYYLIPAISSRIINLQSPFV